MFAQLPLPYPDELLYSVIGRYFTYFPPSGFRSATSRLFGGKADALVEFPRRLDDFSEATRLTWGMTSEQIISDCTLLPFYSHYSDEKVLDDCVRAMKTGKAMPIQSRLGITNRGGRVESPQYLRFCKNCSQADINRFGETYWRRQHQLPGVVICTEHIAVLSQSTALMHAWGPNYFDATQSILTGQSRLLCKLNAHELELAKLVAVRCANLLNKRDGIWPKKQCHTAYRNAAMNRGFRQGLLRVNLVNVTRAFREFYGEKLLIAFGCPVGKIAQWIERIFQRSVYGFHPLQHILIQLFLESSKEDCELISRIGTGPWKCPSSFGSHSNTFPISTIVIRREKDGTQYAGATCTCGFAFNFKCTSQADPGRPVVMRVNRIGSNFHTEVLKLKKSGLRNREIAKRLNTTDAKISKLIRRCDTSSEQTAKIALWRRQWTRDRKRSIYQLLRKYDRQWLSTQRSKPVNKSEVVQKRRKRTAERWADRDQIWATKIATAATEIRNMFPSRKVTKNAIMLVSGLRSLNRIINSGLLPECEMVMKSKIESLKQWRERRHASRNVESDWSGQSP